MTLRCQLGLMSVPALVHGVTWACVHPYIEVLCKQKVSTEYGVGTPYVVPLMQSKEQALHLLHFPKNLFQPSKTLLKLSVLNAESPLKHLLE
jgi:hypothetical protein